MSDGKTKQGDQDDSVRGEAVHDYSYNQRTGSDESESPSEIEWENPPVYELVGSAPNASTKVVAQGKLTCQSCCCADETVSSMDANFDLCIDDGRVAINILTSDKLSTLVRIPSQPTPYTLPNSSNSKSPHLNVVIQIVGSRGRGDVLACLLHS